jgi:hypothetical protein
MNKTLRPFRTLFFFYLLCVCHVKSFSQVSVVSTNGYAVNIDVRAQSIETSATSCTYGFNYRVNLRYSITITGNNIPSSLYTFQGTVGCGPTSSFFDLPNNGGSGTVLSSNAWNSASICNTATVNSMRCNTVTIEISGPGISYRTITFSAVAAPLAVKLISFTAIAERNSVKLNWTTASETNNDYFTIERSADGAQWQTVKKVNGAGNSNNILNYESYDEAPLEGTSYYRLKQTDFDGTTTYSNVQAVTFAPVAGVISIYPVPNTGNTINFKGIADYKNHELAVVNAGGAVVFNTVLVKASAELPALQPGLYIIRVKNKMTGEMQSLRYVKI